MFRHRRGDVNSIWRRLGAVVLLGYSVLAGAADKPPGCPKDDCVTRGPSPYPHIVIGRLIRVGTDEEMRQLYRWAKPGVWKDFPDDEADYLERNRVLLLPLDAKGTPAMVHMSHEEFRRVTFRVGDLVRYTPRMAGSPGGEGRSIYSSLAGCIAILCRAEDAACAERYRTGVFRRSDGVQVDPKHGKPVMGGIVIDPLSLLPKTAEATAARH